jgi:hypothetical protein
MAKQKPYLDGIETRSRMLRNIESLLDEEAMPEELEQKCYALMSFYRNPPPEGMQYSWNHLWVMCSEFNQLYAKLQKQPKTKLRRRINAVEIAIDLWIKGHHFDEETGMVKIIPIPQPKPPLTEKEKEICRASINATWRRGSRDS